MEWAWSDIIVAGSLKSMCACVCVRARIHAHKQLSTSHPVSVECWKQKLCLESVNDIKQINSFDLWFLGETGLARKMADGNILDTTMIFNLIFFTQSLFPLWYWGWDPELWMC